MCRHKLGVWLAYTDFKPWVWGDGQPLKLFLCGSEHTLELYMCDEAFFFFKEYCSIVCTACLYVEQNKW